MQLLDQETRPVAQDQRFMRLLQGGAGVPSDAEAAAKRIIRSLTARQAARLAGEIAVLFDAFENRNGGPELVAALQRIERSRLTLVDWTELPDGHLSLADAPGRLDRDALLSETASAWLRFARSGTLLTRSGSMYKPASLRSHEGAMRLRLVPALGERPLRAITRVELQDHIYRWRDQGLSGSSIEGTVAAARVLWRDFELLSGIEGALAVDPTRGLRWPTPKKRRERVVSSAEARALLDAVEECDRAIWATALYSGLRYGELRALHVRGIDLERRRIIVCRGWDAHEGPIETKSARGLRTIPVTRRLARILEAHLRATGRADDDLVFGVTANRPFNTGTLLKYARRAWHAYGLELLTLHECRHSAISQWFDAGLQIDKVSRYAGHSSIVVTIDIYDHLLPEHEIESAELLDAYHARHLRRARRQRPAA